MITLNDYVKSKNDSSDYKDVLTYIKEIFKNVKSVENVNINIYNVKSEREDEETINMKGLEK